MCRHLIQVSTPSLNDGDISLPGAAQAKDKAQTKDKAQVKDKVKDKVSATSDQVENANNKVGLAIQI